MSHRPTAASFITSFSNPNGWYNFSYIVNTTRPLPAVLTDPSVKQIGVAITSEDGCWLYMPADHPVRFQDILDDPFCTHGLSAADHAVYIADPEKMSEQDIMRYRYYCSISDMGLAGFAESFEQNEELPQIGEKMKNHSLAQLESLDPHGEEMVQDSRYRIFTRTKENPVCFTAETVVSETCDTDPGLLREKLPANGIIRIDISFEKAGEELVVNYSFSDKSASRREVYPIAQHSYQIGVAL